ncbi:MAG: DUF4231 domain-containing protein [Mycoplasmataceae bacterium]|nr:DUF4231 domain-containing protein [Mycoplasmataceae bacterium]
MNKNERVDKWFLLFDAKVFVEKELYKSKTRHRRFSIAFIFLNIVSILATFLVASLTVVVFSKIVWSSIPDWFFITTTSITAITTFILSIINFFYVKDKMAMYKSRVNFIHSEIIKYESNVGVYAKSKNKDFDIFQRITSHMNYGLAKEWENE